MELKHVYLQGSWVLGINAADDHVCFDLEACLERDHPLFYWPPKEGEVSAYALVRWCLHGEVHWNEGPHLDRPTIDPSGEADYGNIDAWWQEGSTHFVEGEWGSVVVNHARQTVEYLDHKQSSETPRPGHDGP